MVSLAASVSYDRLFASILRAEIVDQCWLAEASEKQLRAILEVPVPTPPDGYVTPVEGGPAPIDPTDPFMHQMIEIKMARWAPAQTILLAAAFVSSTLCLSKDDTQPSSNPTVEERRLHRKSIARMIVSEAKLPALEEICERTVRNQLIHTEQKVLRWARGRREAGYIGPLGSWGWGIGNPPQLFYRWLDEKSWELWVNDQHCNLRKMVAELRALALVVPIKVGVETRPSQRDYRGSGYGSIAATDSAGAR